MIPQEVRDLAAGIADDIETHGHWQGQRDGLAWDDTNPRGKCCVVASPTWVGAGRDVCKTLRHVLGLSDPVNLYHWNDETPTPEVLATLRKIAAGKTP